MRVLTCVRAHSASCKERSRNFKLKPCRFGTDGADDYFIPSCHDKDLACTKTLLSLSAPFPTVSMRSPLTRCVSQPPTEQPINLNAPGGVGIVFIKDLTDCLYVNCMVRDGPAHRSGTIQQGSPRPFLHLHLFGQGCTQCFEIGRARFFLYPWPEKFARPHCRRHSQVRRRPRRFHPSPKDLWGLPGKNVNSVSSWQKKHWGKPASNRIEFVS